MDVRRWTDKALVPAVLFAALIQLAIGADFSKTGEQLTAGVPLATVVLLLGLGIAVLLYFPKTIPVIPTPRLVWIGCMCLGLAGMARGELGGAVKELIQLAEIAVLSVWLFATLRGPTGMKRIRLAFAAIFAILAVLAFTGRAAAAPFYLSPTKTCLFLTIAWPFLCATLAGLRPAHAMSGFAVAGLAYGALVPHPGFLAAFAAAGAVALASRMRRAARPLAAAAVLAVLASVCLPAGESPWRLLRPRYDAEHLRRGTIEALASRHAVREMPLGGGLGRYKDRINQLKQSDALVPHPEDMKIRRDGNSQYLLTVVESGLPAGIALAVCLALAATGVWREAKREAPEAAAEQYAVAGALAAVAVAGLFGVFLSRGVGIWVGALLGMAEIERADMPVKGRLLRLAACGAFPVAGLAVLLANGPMAPSDPGVLNRAVAGIGGRSTASPLRVVVLPDALAGEASGLIVRMEAEGAEAIEEPFRVIEDYDAGQGQALAIPSGAGKGRGMARYTVNIARAGSYRLFARVYWDDGCSNSVRFVLGEPGDAILDSELFREWHTLEAPRPFTLPAGPLEVVVRNLEDGIRIDSFGFRPVGDP